MRGLVEYIRTHLDSFAVFCRVRHASSGGDMVPPELLEDLKDIFTRAEVYVIYGCSEISCMGCTWPVSRDHEIVRTYVGRPFDDVTVRIFDKDRKAVPAGVVGEIYLQAAVLSRVI